MHHALRFYSRHREAALHFYMFWARWTRIPLVGGLVRWVANHWGRNLEGGYVLTTAEAEAIVEAAEGLALGPCACRQVYHNCDNPVDVEIMLAPEGNVFVHGRPGDYRPISPEEAKAILRDCHHRGLVHTIIRCRDGFYAICNCCQCCCVPLRLHSRYGIGQALRRDRDIVEVFRQRALTRPGG